MIFLSLRIEQPLRENDKTRLDASGVYSNNDDISLVKLTIDGVDYDITEDRYLDYSFNAGVSTVTLTVETSGGSSKSDSYTVHALSASDDIVFSDDNDLITIEDDIINYIRDGRDTFLDKHRLARELILDELDANRIFKEDGSRYQASDVVDIEDFRKWSMFLVLSFIFRSISTQSDDIFRAKASKYEAMANDAKKRSFFRLSEDSVEVDVDNFTGELVRR